LLVVGLGRAGLAFLVIFGGLDYLTRYGAACDTALVSHVVGWVPGAVVVGIIFGLFYWLIMEKQYKA